MANDAVEKMAAAVDEYLHAVNELSHAIELIGHLFPSIRDNAEVRGYVESAMGHLKEGKRILLEE